MLSSMSQPPAVTPAAILAPLASQHHTSEYNRLKFGLNGCPIRYRPVSLDQPHHFHQLRQRQELNAQAPAWWHSTRPHTHRPLLLGPCSPDTPDTRLLHDQIMAAIADPLPAPPSRPPSPSAARLKTSATHPINISAIIPDELLPLISSQATHADLRLSPTVLDIPLSFTLDHLIRSRARHPPQHHHHLPLPPHPPMLAHIRTRLTISEALQSAINSGLASAEDYESQHLRSQPHPHPRTKRKKHTLAALVTESTVSLSISSLSLPAPPSLAPPIMRPALSDQSHLHDFSQSPTQIASCSSNPPGIALGNLYMSSCPGKKVRLQGPIKGRSGVCRDLSADLARMKNLGIGCIVCCLDDEELDFLGVPWPEYQNTTRDMGIDVLRIPTPEGLAPLTPAALDLHLTQLINAYTLKGTPVLVHCRGGVGRAGVVACCWLIKLGLCGWVDDFLGTPKMQSNKDSPLPGKETVQFVERVIALVRKRRSVKAVETFEQVYFLVAFVEYCHEKIQNAT